MLELQFRPHSILAPLVTSVSYKPNFHFLDCIWCYLTKIQMIYILTVLTSWRTFLPLCIVSHWAAMVVAPWLTSWRYMIQAVRVRACSFGKEVSDVKPAKEKKNPPSSGYTLFSSPSPTHTPYLAPSACGGVWVCIWRWFWGQLV